MITYFRIRILFPLLVALSAYTVRFILDLTCSHWSTVCKGSSEILSHLYAVVICFMLIIAITKAKQISEYVQRIKAAFEMITADGQKAKKE